MSGTGCGGNGRKSGCIVFWESHTVLIDGIVRSLQSVVCVHVYMCV